MTKVGASAAVVTITGVVVAISVDRTRSPLWLIGAVIVGLIGVAVLLGIYAFDAAFRAGRDLIRDKRKL